MSYLDNYAAPHIMAANAPADARTAFIRRTYLHLAGALLLFTGLEFVLVNSPFAEIAVRTMTASQYGWLVVLALFMAVGWVADKWARSSASPAMQYAGLGLYIVAESIIFLPLLYVAAHFSDASVIPTAGVLTLTLFGGLTALAFTSRVDFSFMGKILMIASFIGLGAILCGVMFGVSLGFFFSLGMVGLAGGYILYYTSQIMFHYRTDQHVAASLALFAAVALLFYYILRIVMSMSRD